MIDSRGRGFLHDHLGALSEAALASRETLAAAVERYAELVRETIAGGGRLLMCGNGGSAATVEHIAAEYTVRFQRERPPLPALALTAGSAALTAAANDFGFEQVFARAVEAHARPGDLLVVHSTSGESENIVRAVEAARAVPISTVGLLGSDGGRLAALVDLPLVVPATDTAHVQELHLAIEHAVADHVDEVFAARELSGE